MPIELHPIGLKGRTTAPVDDTDATTQSVIDANVALYVRRGCMAPWLGYFAVLDGKVVGTCGFTGPPQAGEVEIAYYSFPGCEGRGVATTMATALMQLAQPAADAGGICFIAHTLPQEGPSPAILRKLGFRCLGTISHPEDGEVWKWRCG